LSSDATRDVVPDMRAYVADGVSMCLACHEPDVVNHPLGARPEFPVPADLPLDPAGKISCLTCHYTHGPLTGIRPRSSVSLLERLFERDRLHKTFLLRRENGRGQLCMACHDS
jgi:formate-dependent nitrite reductase cytochrome c552 subunit